MSKKKVGILAEIRGLYQPNEGAKFVYFRKWTIIAHWFYGALCAYLLTVCIPLSIALLVLFGIWERWSDSCDGGREGAMDWWDAFVVFIAGLVLILILRGGSIG